MAAAAKKSNAKKATAPKKAVAKKVVAKKAAPKKGAGASKRTTMRSSKGTKLYAVRDSQGRFKDIQTFKRAQAADMRKKSKAELAQEPPAEAPTGE